MLQWKRRGQGATPPPPNAQSTQLICVQMFNDDVYIALLLGYLLYSMVKLYLGEQTRRYSRSAAYRQECTSRYVYSRSTMSLSTEDTETLMSFLWYRRITDTLRKCEYTGLSQLKEYPKIKEKKKILYIV
jgi:hypothetical protein